MSRSKNVSVQIKDVKPRQSKVFTNFYDFKNYETNDDEEQFHSIIDIGLGGYRYDLDEDEFKSVEDLDQFEVSYKRPTIQKRVTFSKRVTIQRVKQKSISVIKETDEESSYKHPQVQNHVDKSLESTKNEIELEIKNIGPQQDLSIETSRNPTQKLNSTVYPSDKPLNSDNQTKTSFYGMNNLNMIQTESIAQERNEQLQDQKYYESNQFQRLYNLNQKQRNKVKKRKELILYFTSDLIYLILLQMQRQQKVTNFLLLNQFGDFLIRLTFVVFIIVTAVYTKNETNTSWFIYLIILLYLPRIFHIMTLIKLLFLNKYKFSNLQLQPLSHLVRSNFIDEPAYIDHDIHPDKREPPTNIVSTRLVLYIIMPIEMSLCILPINRRQRQKSLWTYVIMCYILQGIEMIVFQPIIFFMVIYHLENKGNKYQIFQYVTLSIVIFAVLKYIIVSGILLARGNKMIHKAQTEQYYNMHTSQKKN